MAIIELSGVTLFLGYSILRYFSFLYRLQFYSYSMFIYTAIKIRQFLLRNKKLMKNTSKAIKQFGEWSGIEIVTINILIVLMNYFVTKNIWIFLTVLNCILLKFYSEDA